MVNKIGNLPPSLWRFSIFFILIISFIIYELTSVKYRNNFSFRDSVKETFTARLIKVSECNNYSFVKGNGKKIKVSIIDTKCKKGWRYNNRSRIILYYLYRRPVKIVNYDKKEEKAEKIMFWYNKSQPFTVKELLFRNKIIEEDL